MSLPEYELYQPRTISEALERAAELNGDSAFVAGGTDLLPSLKQHINPKRHLISLSRIDALAKLSPFVLGAGVTIASLIRAGGSIPPVLRETAKRIAGPALREAATVGGNLLFSGRCVYLNRSESYRCSRGACMKAEGEECIVVPQKEKCYAPSSGDLAPVFLVLGASFRIAGTGGEQVLPATRFFRPNGMEANVLQAGELLTEVILPRDAGMLEAKYLKLRLRSAMDFPEAGVAAAVKRDAKGVSELRVALGALAPNPLYCVKGRDELGDLDARELAQRIWEEVVPDVLAVRNSFFRPSYRKEMTRLYLRRILEELLQT
ncbi:MAG: FAD binding domain-containing protein [Acidobacteriota bacterium]